MIIPHLEPLEASRASTSTPLVHLQTDVHLPRPRYPCRHSGVNRLVVTNTNIVKYCNYFRSDDTVSQSQTNGSTFSEMCDDQQGPVLPVARATGSIEKWPSMLAGEMISLDADK